MAQSNKTALVILLVLVAAFVAGVRQLTQTRFEAGDVYPRYSSLRSDPLGTKALYEGLERMSQLRVTRNYEPLTRIEQPRHTTVFCAGTRAALLEYSGKENVQEIDGFLAEGGRLVVALAPIDEHPLYLHDDEPSSASKAMKKLAGKKSDNKTTSPCDQDLQSSASDLQRTSLLAHWGASFGYEDLPRDQEQRYTSTTAVLRADLDLERTVDLHTALWLDHLENPWQVVYGRGQFPVLARRSFGRGEIVLCADSYLLSNQAIWQSRCPKLLAWLVGERKTVVFDEMHLGLAESPGIASLARKYRLHGLAAGLLLLAGLFIWRNAFSLVPASADDSRLKRQQLVSGRDSFSGLVNLLRRSIAPRALLEACVREWENSSARRPQAAPEKLKRITALAEHEQAQQALRRDPVAAYNAIARILAERK